MGTTRVGLGAFAPRRFGTWIATGCAACVVLASVSARADDARTIQSRLAPRAAPAGAPDTHIPAAAPAWMPEEAVQREREHAAAGVGEAYVADHLDAWLDDTPLEALARLRRTDFVIAGKRDEPAAPAVGPAEAVPSGGLDVRVRLAEKVRLTVARDAFRRDLFYDPLRNRMSMDLFRGALPGTGAGIALTETYRVDGGANRLLLTLSRPLE
jgi:hypothetical protein